MSMRYDWQEVDSTLQKTFAFNDFREALAFVNKVGEIAEEAEHHPDICIRNYKNVFISTTTHDKGRIVTKKDFDLAKAIDAAV